MRALPDLQAKTVRDMPIPNSATRGPPQEWINERGPTPRCRSCNICGIDDSKAVRTQRCRDRYAEFLRQSFNPDPILLDEREKDLGDLEVPEVVEWAFQDQDGGDELPPMDWLFAPEDEVEYRLEVGNDYEPAGPAVVPVESVELVGDDVGADVVGMDVERDPLQRAPFPSVEGYSMAIQRRMSQLGGDKVVVPVLLLRATILQMLHWTLV